MNNKTLKKMPRKKNSPKRRSRRSRRSTRKQSPTRRRKSPKRATRNSRNSPRSPRSRRSRRSSKRSKDTALLLKAFVPGHPLQKLFNPYRGEFDFHNAPKTSENIKKYKALARNVKKYMRKHA